MPSWRTLLLLAVLLGGAPSIIAAQTVTTTSSSTTTTIHACTGEGSVEIWARNESGLPGVTLDVEGVLDAEAVTCGGEAGSRTSYADTVVCTGNGIVRCADAQGIPARIGGLRPGSWVHRVGTTVPVAAGEPVNDTQRQARRGVVVASSSSDAGATSVVWTVHGFTRAITSDEPGVLRDALFAATLWTRAHPERHALITLRPSGPIRFTDQAGCPADPACDPSLTSPKAGLCIIGDRIVIDGRDDQGRRAAALDVGASIQPVVRVYGEDVELRGLMLTGSTAVAVTQADTLSFMSTARRSVLVDSTVIGPGAGDGIASCGGGSDADANLLVDSVVRGAEDKGVKVSGDGVQVVSGSCIADNANGGIQATLGGRVIARENVVQHNVPAGAENGIFATDSDGEPSSVTTRGNIVRFAGERGLSVVDNALGEFHDDYVARNQYTGARIETTRPGVAPQASFTGVAFVCNKVDLISGSCTPETPPPPSTVLEPCIDDGDCAENESCKATFPDGAGLGIQFPRTRACACASAPCPCLPPAVAVTSIATTDNKRTLDGANLQLNVPGASLAAGGTQWEGCTSSACDDADEAAVRSANVREAPGAHVELLPIVASDGGLPTLASVSPPRPRAGRIVRVYGTGFDAVSGNDLSSACQDPPARDADFCDPSEPRLAQVNRGSSGNRLRLLIGPQAWILDLVAVTPTMLAFRMPVDCFAPASLELRTPGDGPIRIAACDAAGCDGQPGGVACADDGNPCTGDVCDGAGACVHPPLPATTICRAAAGPCDLAESCDGAGSPCPVDAKHRPERECRGAVGPCDRPETCDGLGDECPVDQMRDAARVCRAAVGPCDVSETCDGVTAACPPDLLRRPGDVCRVAAGVCDVAETCDGVTVRCPEDRKSTAPCRAAAGACDREEVCSGASDVCPDDARLPAGTVCRAAVGACDVAERCDGSAGECPMDSMAPAGTECRAARGACDLPETCGGATPACPEDARRTGPDAIACRLSEVSALLDRGCGPKRARQASLLARSTAAHGRAEDACTAGKVRRARTNLRRTQQALGRLGRLVAADPCLGNGSAAQGITDVQSAVRELAGRLAISCRGAEAVQSRNAPLGEPQKTSGISNSTAYFASCAHSAPVSFAGT